MSDHVTVVIYEDQYFGQLHNLVKRIRTRDLSRPAAIIEPTTVRGDGGFANELRRQLKTLQRQTKRLPDRIVCVADADRPANLVAGMNLPPIGSSLTEVDAWLTELESAWLASLLAAAGVIDAETSKVHALCVRWNKESLLISCPGALEAFAGEARSEVSGILASCIPPPSTVADVDYLQTYRHPLDCIGRVVHAAFERKYKIRPGRRGHHPRSPHRR